MAPLARWHRRLVESGPQGVAERLLFALLIPMGWLYGLFGRLRAACYRRGLLVSYRAPVPVIAVGNLTVGGTGKTPMVDHLVRLLLARGKRVAVVSRGYGGRQTQGVGVVSAGSGPLLPPESCGDEPFLLAARNPGALVLVAPRRAEGVRLAVERLGAEVVILDDGFQHLAVQRDLDIVLLDAGRPLGNGQVLPAGALREFPSALRRGDLFVLTRCDGAVAPRLPVAGTALRCRHRLADEARSLSGETLPLVQLAARKAVAFAGIADPHAFFAALTLRGLQLTAAVPLADHVVYDRRTLERLAAVGRNADFLVTTEKDGVKLTADQFALSCYQIPLVLEFFDDDAGQLAQAVDALFNKQDR